MILLLDMSLGFLLDDLPPPSGRLRYLGRFYLSVSRVRLRRTERLDLFMWKTLDIII